MQYGLKRPDVLEFKQKLVKLGFASWDNPTTYFGPSTQSAVEKFQRYYNLDIDGVMGPDSLNTLESAVNSLYQRGNRSQSIQEIKYKLQSIGFGKHWKNPTTYFGPDTEKVVRDFQKNYGLIENGIIEQKTMSKIEELLGPEETNTQYNITFNNALNIQNDRLQQTDKYRNEPAYISASYVEITEHGVIKSTGNVNLRTSPSLKSNDNVDKTGKNGDKVTIIGEVKGDKHAGSTKWYKIKHKKDAKILYIHSSLVNPNGMVAKTTANVNVRSNTNTSSHIYGLISSGKEVTIISKGDNWHRISYGTWRNPTRSDIEYYLNPSNNDKFQHLVLSSTVKVSASELNKVLKGKGVLEGLGQAFIDGGEKHSVNEVYLISHALLETGHGTSELAKGIEVGLNKNGNPVLATSSNKNNLTKVKKVYNTFGIGAADSDPKRLGAIRAYEEGWTSPKKAVEGGAKFIGERYIHNSYKQNTLYKMRWNPASPGTHQYATDIGWAVKQVKTIKSLYEKINGASLHFDIPKYK